MDTRTVMVAALALALGGCAGTDFDATPIPGHAAAVSEAGSGPGAAPETPEDRAELVMDVTADACLEAPELCEAEEDDVLAGLAWEYPDVQVPYYVWRFPTSDEQEMRTVGLTLGVSISDQLAYLERGNTLTYPFNEDP